MAKLFQVTEESVDTLVHDTPVTKLYGASKVVDAIEIGGKAYITLEGKTPNATQTERVVSEDLATVVAGINALEGDDRVLSLSVVADTAYSKLFNIQDIVEVYEDPNNVAQSVIVSKEYRKSRGVELIVDETVANILAAANA